MGFHGVAFVIFAVATLRVCRGCLSLGPDEPDNYVATNDYDAYVVEKNPIARSQNQTTFDHVEETSDDYYGEDFEYYGQLPDYDPYHSMPYDKPIARSPPDANPIGSQPTPNFTISIPSNNGDGVAAQNSTTAAWIGDENVKSPEIVDTALSSNLSLHDAKVMLDWQSTAATFTSQYHMPMSQTTTARQDDADARFLSKIGTRHLSMFFTWFCIVYLYLLCGWEYLCWKREAGARSIHVLMGVLIMLSCVSMAFKSSQYKTFNEDGARSELVDLASCVVAACRDIMFIGVLFLAGSCWSLTSKSLGVQAKVALATLVLMQLAGETLAVYSERAVVRGERMDWYLRLGTMIDVSRLLVVAFAPCFNAVRAEQWTHQFKSFYECFIIFSLSHLILPTLVVANGERWVMPVVAEVQSLIFYLLVGWFLQPQLEGGDKCQRVELWELCKELKPQHKRVEVFDQTDDQMGEPEKRSAEATQPARSYDAHLPDSWV